METVASVALLIMGVLAILLTDSTRGPFSPALLLFLLGLPFLDTLGVAGQRLVEGRSPFIGDRKHIHHKLMTAGLSHYEAVTAIYAIQAGMVGLAYLLRWQSDTLIVPLYLILAGAVLALFIAAGMTDSYAATQVRAFGRTGGFRISQRPWCATADSILGAVVPLFLIASVFFLRLSDDVSYIPSPYWHCFTWPLVPSRWLRILCGGSTWVVHFYCMSVMHHG